MKEEAITELLLKIKKKNRWSNPYILVNLYSKENKDKG